MPGESDLHHSGSRQHYGHGSWGLAPAACQPTALDRFWVKVVQRLPVRLELDVIDPDRPLFSGISVTVEVDTGYRSTLWNLLQTVQVVEAAQ
jgi:multidrug resistance efflux pump